ncbi:MAG: hypothetical protein KC776_40580 [Myxococcales bacterium]|nr:hypothetical protein [Myxococcales bacterium]MCB9583414.1 hypothetical protein [Polyangiaceae bacterium]
MKREYEYVGPAEIGKMASAPIDRLQPQSADNIRDWLADGEHELTYVVDSQGRLWLSDRRTEHVACAQGARVQGAGELVLEVSAQGVAVVSVTNQSTGYCPEASCWDAVRPALVNAGLCPPTELTHSFEFRRCPQCGGINLLKLEMPECGECGSDLPAHWNFA